ncbi:MAG TPA: hypothetical protein PK668_06935 [Myxococcota bacterium]|nr:hypothetical protein [Myxococcota bacterium]HRY92421.1 hypothetical protein [Myxococcota bacterium]
MQRTGLSIAGGVAILVASLFTGIGGFGFTIAGKAGDLMDMAREQMAKQQAPRTEAEARQLEDARAKMAEAEEMLARSDVQDKMKSMRSYGKFELLAALVGLIGGIALLTATGFGKAAGVVAAVLGLITCAWGFAVTEAALLQILFALAYGVGLFGALSLAPAPTPAQPRPFG